MALITKTVQVDVDVEIDFDDFDAGELINLVNDLEASGRFTIIDDYDDERGYRLIEGALSGAGCPSDLAELLVTWLKRPLYDQLELAEWLRNHS